MSLRTSPWRSGIPCWVELGTPDLLASAAFYGYVLGWTVPDDTEPSGPVVARRGAAAVAGLGPVRDVPAGWTVHFATDDADASLQKAVALGGAVVSSLRHVGTASRTGLIADPNGVVFGLWQAGDSIGSSLVNESGGLCWEELRSPDPSAARTFYGDLFGYNFDVVPAEGPDYAIFRLPDETVPLGAITASRASDETPARWLPFFGVKDAHVACDDTIRRGGSVILPDFETPEGRMAELADPQGNRFWVITSTGQAQPDRSG